MVEAGISLVQALTALYEQADPKRQGASAGRRQRHHSAGTRGRNIP